MCKYHGTHVHRTEDWRQLREEVARLFNEGHLREFLSNRGKNHFRERDAGKKSEPEEPQHVIHMIIGGVEPAGTNIQTHQSIHHKGEADSGLLAQGHPQIP